ncbi:M1 family metallopeptidase [Nibrella viscosa]|uniref:M1 family metallopeptidase n=1 Tax=Nibrella viscosa TaxID=1084524 RepID=A0ABP8KFT5_9BACT
MKHWLPALFAVFYALTAAAQQPDSTYRFTRQDTLRGGLRPERTSYDVTFYDLNLSVNPATRTIDGSNTIRYRVKEPFRRMQIDLFDNMQIAAITQNGQKLTFKRDGNAVFVDMKEAQPVGQLREVKVTYSGSPQVAKNPPWDGGFLWRQDPSGKSWVTVTCQGTGASLWWPCKDHLSDEPDSMRITCRVPNGLTCVSNGTLQSKRPARTAGQTEFIWYVRYPINIYNVTLNIANYAYFKDEYRSLDRQTLALNYYVLPQNLEKANVHFEQVKAMLDCYEKYFGKFPFWRDGYKLVETPYWGMEHQTAIAYGNNYRNTPFGFDFIIIHESGHEYFGNSLSAGDSGEMWIHEAFATYAEALYMECTHSIPKAIEYLNMQRKLIKNQHPMLGPLGVNYQHRDTDIYYKGSWMLHTLRHAVDNDNLWFKALKALATEKKLSIVNTDEVIDFLELKTQVDLQSIADQYLKYTGIPVLEYKVLAKNDKQWEIRHRWVADTKGFNLPVKVRFGFGEWQTIYPKTEWSATNVKFSSGWLNFNTDYGLFTIRQVRLE